MDSTSIALRAVKAQALLDLAKVIEDDPVAVGALYSTESVVAILRSAASAYLPAPTDL